MDKNSKQNLRKQILTILIKGKSLFKLMLMCTIINKCTFNKIQK